MKNALLILCGGLILAAALTGCSNNPGGSITAPHPEVTQSTPFTINARYLPSRTPAAATRAAHIAAGGIDITPVAGDEVWIFGTLADSTGNTNWQAKQFWGLLQADGTVDRPFRRMVAAGGESYTFLPVVMRDGLPYPMIGLWTVNGIGITAVDHSVYGDIFTFRVTRDGSNQALIDPIRNDYKDYAWYRLVVTGVEPDSVQRSKPVTGDLDLTFFATHTRLWTEPMIYSEAEQAWVQYVWAKPNAMIFVRVDYNQDMWRAGVYLEGAAGQRRLLTNVTDVDTDPNNAFYPVMPATLNGDGTWTVPNPAIDNRWIPIGLGS